MKMHINHEAQGNASTYQVCIWADEDYMMEAITTEEPESILGELFKEYSEAYSIIVEAYDECGNFIDWAMEYVKEEAH